MRQQIRATSVSSRAATWLTSCSRPRTRPSLAPAITVSKAATKCVLPGEPSFRPDNSAIDDRYDQEMARLAVLSYHTSPLAQPGTGDGGGMNVYVRELSSALARLGHEVDVYTRRDNPLVNDIEFVEPGFRVHHVEAGPPTALDRDGLTDYVGEFTDAVKVLFERDGTPDAIHAN